MVSQEVSGLPEQMLKWLMVGGLLCSAYLISIGEAAAQDASEISYDRDVRPLLSDRCFACHGPDEASRQAGLRLDQESAAHEYAIIPEDPSSSEVWLRITSDDESMVMPPADSHKKPLSEAEKSVIRKWIEQGAQYEKFWAFEVPEHRPATAVDNQAWNQNEIDRLAYSRMSQAGRSPSKTADPRTLIRRLSLDLTGLPPTPDEIHQFLQRVEQVGHGQAWQEQVDRLLQSPHYGEHQARYWLDLVRFADTNGMHKDFYRNHFAYRDWVIRSFNQDVGYDRFLRDQLAGDLVSDPTDDQLTASAFNRMHLIIDRGTALPEESFHKNVIDRVTSVGTAFLGLTVQCAQCHDHKYDPISQKEFYSLYAFFNNLDVEPETTAWPENGLQEPFISLADHKQQNKLDRFDQQIAAVQQQIEELKTATPASDVKGTSPAEPVSFRDNRSQLEKLKQKLNSLQQARREFNHHVPYAMVSRERNEIRPTHVLQRGLYDKPGELVKRGTPAFLPPLNPEQETATRLDLANWFLRTDHPLTSRVAVNRIWQNIFGVGLVKTAEDFGAQGENPSHPRLLDYLAVRLRQLDWKLKPLIREIVLSQTYQQSSTASPAAFQADPENRLLSRGSRYRLDAEVIRDQILLSSGTLRDTMYGPSVKPPQPDGLWQAVTMIGERYVPDQGPGRFRRSLYTFWKRGMPPPQMTILNAPNRDACIARRERTNTPAQALLLLNEPAYMEAATEFARLIVQQPPEQRIEFAWERVTGQIPNEQEVATVSSLLKKLGTTYQEKPELVEQMKLERATDDKTLLASWAVVINTLYNLDITRTRY